MLRRALPPLALLALLLVPPASAWTLRLDAPSEAPVGLPFLARACVDDAPPGSRVEVRLDLRAEDGTRARALRDGHPARGDRYGPARLVDGRGVACDEVAFEHPGPPGAAAIDARVRPEGGDAKSKAAAPLRLVQAPVSLAHSSAPVTLLDEGGRALLRIPPVAGVVWIPLLGNVTQVATEEGTAAPPPALDLRLVEARRHGVTLLNAGAGRVHLDAFHLLVGKDVLPLPRSSLAPGAHVHLSPVAPPDASSHAALDLPALKGDVSLRAAGMELSRLRVPPLREGEAVLAGGRLARLGMTNVSPTPLVAEGQLLLYATPDAGAAPVLDLVGSARREILVEGYTLTSPDVAAALLDAHARGVRVRVLLEGAPVGGVSPAQAELTGVLAREGVEVSRMAAHGGFPARYPALHAKFLVADREAVLVATENLHPSSYPAVAGREGTRGFGVVVRNATLARVFAEVFEVDATPWPDVVRVEPAPADVPRPVPRAGARAGPSLLLEGRWDVTPVLSPDAGAEGVLALLRGATRSLDVALLFAEETFGDAPSPLLEAALDAARRGVRVRVLLDGHLDAERNAHVADALREAVAREGLPLDARLSRPGQSLHAKLVLVDGARTYVGSMNWGEASALRNREAGLVLGSEEAAGWYGAWFEEEWEKEEVGPRREVGTGPAEGIALVAALSLLPLRPRGRARRA